MQPRSPKGEVASCYAGFRMLHAASAREMPCPYGRGASLRGNVVSPMINAFLDFLAAIIGEAMFQLPMLPRDSDDWNRRRRKIAIWFLVILFLVVAIFVFALLNAFGVAF